MATRREIQQQRDAFKEQLRRELHSGHWASGVLLPPEREFAAQHGLSRKSVAMIMSELIDEGLLRREPRVGTFAGRTRHSTSGKEGAFLLVYPYEPRTSLHAQLLSMGFEERIAELGGSSLVLKLEGALSPEAQRQMPPILGVFEFNEEARPTGWANLFGESKADFGRVCFGEVSRDEMGVDGVFFDNIDGGFRATDYLIRKGHRNVAFLGLHGHSDEPGVFVWSQERAEGWKKALEASSLSTEGMLFCEANTTPISPYDQTRTARAAAIPLMLQIRRGNVSAVVTANGFASEGLFEALKESAVPWSQWPNVVAFDEQTHTDSHIVSSLHLPWNEVGRSAADLLWQRRQGSLSPEPQQRLVEMRLISRLTCQPAWASVAGLPSHLVPSSPSLIESSNDPVAVAI